MPLKTLNDDWRELLKHEFEQPYFSSLIESVSRAYKTSVVYPPAELVFNALQLCSFQQTKAVIIGQDPYHGYGQANGLSFSVNDGMRKPPSLQNIFKELQSDIPGFQIPESGNLEAWSKQGVLMLNAVLTVEEAKPGSHKAFGWVLFTNALIKLISDKKEKVVFLLWGNYAITKSELIDSTKHLVLTAAHPSPLARGKFFGSKHFSKTNTYLIENQLKPINWFLT
ncbi:uracil-DNA glycosylase [Sphingobacteriaceae bacterium]|nr:uracil-DNA glycosylase [Sphingobacteriaceae bacterium]